MTYVAAFQRKSDRANFTSRCLRRREAAASDNCRRAEAADLSSGEGDASMGDADRQLIRYVTAGVWINADHITDERRRNILSRADRLKLSSGGLLLLQLTDATTVVSLTSSVIEFN